MNPRKWLTRWLPEPDLRAASLHGWSSQGLVEILFPRPVSGFELLRTH